MSNQESKKLEQKGDLSDKLLPCRKCGMLDYDFWDGKGTQAYLTCNECGQEENIQVTDLYDNVNEWPKFCQRTISYPLPAIDKANKALIAEWNTRAPSKQLTTTQQALAETKDSLAHMKVYAQIMRERLDSAVEALKFYASEKVSMFDDSGEKARATLASIKE